MAPPPAHGDVIPGAAPAAPGPAAGAGGDGVGGGGGGGDAAAAAAGDGPLLPLPPADDADLAATDVGSATRFRADITIHNPGITHVIDVTVVTAKRGKPGAAARAAEARKGKHYTSVYSFTPGTQVVPFAMETCGKLGPAASAFTQFLRRALVGATLRPGEDPRQVVREVTDEVFGSLSLALARGLAVARLTALGQIAKLAGRHTMMAAFW
jgi:hypothetical protein